MKVQKSKKVDFRINNQHHKYLSIPTIFSWILNIGVIYYSQVIVKYYFDKSDIEDQEINALKILKFLSPQLTILLVLLNILFIALYKLKIPFFEKMKSNTVPWPWELDYEKFRKILPNHIFVYLFNLMVLNPVCLLIYFTFVPQNPLNFTKNYEISFWKLWL